jgi:predicted small secreted protein
MRCRRFAGVAVLVVLISVLLGGCELREGARSEYGEAVGVYGKIVYPEF